MAYANDEFDRHVTKVRRVRRIFLVGAGLCAVWLGVAMLGLRHRTVDLRLVVYATPGPPPPGDRGPWALRVAALSRTAQRVLGVRVDGVEGRDRAGKTVAVRTLHSQPGAYAPIVVTAEGGRPDSVLLGVSGDFGTRSVRAPLWGEPPPPPPVEPDTDAAVPRRLRVGEYDVALVPAGGRIVGEVPDEVLVWVGQGGRPAPGVSLRLHGAGPPVTTDAHGFAILRVRPHIGLTPVQFVVSGAGDASGGEVRVDFPTVSRQVRGTPPARWTRSNEPAGFELHTATGEGLLHCDAWEDGVWRWATVAVAPEEGAPLRVEIPARPKTLAVQCAGNPALPGAGRTQMFAVPPSRWPEIRQAVAHSLHVEPAALGDAPDEHTLWWWASIRPQPVRRPARVADTGVAEQAALDAAYAKQRTGVLIALSTALAAMVAWLLGELLLHFREVRRRERVVAKQLEEADEDGEEEGATSVAGGRRWSVLQALALVAIVVANAIGILLLLWHATSP